MALRFLDFARNDKIVHGLAHFFDLMPGKDLFNKVLKQFITRFLPYKIDKRKGFTSRFDSAGEPFPFILG
jgi:hypothetical protein